MFMYLKNGKTILGTARVHLYTINRYTVVSTACISLLNRYNGSSCLLGVILLIHLYQLLSFHAIYKPTINTQYGLYY